VSLLVGFCHPYTIVKNIEFPYGLSLIAYESKAELWRVSTLDYFLLGRLNLSYVKECVQDTLDE
jgi:hypothetical protein